MQSVSQYDTPPLQRAVATDESRLLDDSLPRIPPADTSTVITFDSDRRKIRAVSVRDDGLFTVHYAHMAAELWLDSTAGWLAVVDGTSQFAMVESFRVRSKAKPIPGKASVIFWTNGPETSD